MTTTNPFSGIIPDAAKTDWVNAIAALVDSCGASNPMILEYGKTKYEDCPNCIFDSAKGASSNRYQTGGPIPFSTGICPYCAGEGRLSTPVTETLYGCAIWNSKEWWPMLAQNNIANPESYVQTISKISDRDELSKCKSIIIDSKRYTRYGQPEPVGFGAPSFVIILWKYMNDG